MNELYSKHEDEIKATCRGKGAGLIDRGFTVARRINDVVEGKKEPSELAEQVAYVGGAWLGIPSGIFNIIFNGIDIAAGDMDFELQDIYKRRPKSERKKD